MVFTFEKAKVPYHCHGLGHRTMVVHGAVACCSRIFHSSCYHLLVQLMYPMNHTENMTQLLVDAQTVDTRCSSTILYCVGLRPVSVHKFEASQAKLTREKNQTFH